MHRPEASRFLEGLSYRKTLLPELWEILSTVMTIPPGEQRNTLSSLLNALNTAGIIEFPKTPKMWDRSAQPPLPTWIKRPSPKVVKEYAEVTWAPELSFLAQKKEPLTSHWLEIDAWLKATRNIPQELVPVRERSLEIFGDEKVLDRLKGSLVFKDGSFSLAVLSCYYVPEPPAWEQGPPGTEGHYGLCIENSTSYEVLRRFNLEAGLWGFVSYGRGEGFSSIVEGIIEKMDLFGHSKLLYFGDADLKGIEIAASGALKLAAVGKTLELDARLYRLILSVDKSLASSKTGGVLSLGAAELVRQAGLHELPGIFLKNLRVAQEWAGYQRLKVLKW